ncbi:uncharacterized protein LOC6575157 [Drosophila mojavensis]|uniref:DUF7775 domain-containing protein n=1 Tax=Drosophila mojavensis TaxID=7230 RepID=B4K9H4_DROMO|nr:uncharacterized protein LOC6575157 [Drosophila mojavensis]EDW16634.1 uncharacterized protein Dmoj_GI22116 [Drosophila mojavensis]
MVIVSTVIYGQDSSDDSTTTTLRPVSFLFYTLESIFNMFCLAYHIKGFMAVDLYMLSWDRHLVFYVYLVTFYVFMVITLFQSINICSGHNPTIGMEIFKSCLASVGFISISILTMWDAERDFHLMYSGREPVDGVYETDRPVHPFSAFLLYQSVASLACGILYMLHATILIDVKLTAVNKVLTEGEDSMYMAIHIYVLGEYVQTKLEKYPWFYDFCSNQRIEI